VPGNEPTGDDATAADAGDSMQSQESWLDRLRQAVGLKGSGSIRDDLAIALADDAVAAGFSPEERAMLANILRLRDVRVDDIMIPRADIDAADIDTTLDELVAAFRASGHSRMPVFRETLDDPVGLVHIKDLIGLVAGAAAPAAESGRDGESASGFDLSQPLARTSLVRNILFVPPSMPVAVLLANMQATRIQMALVIDEYGGTDGLVSLEDAVEMVVGDIEDEYDDDTGPRIVPDGNGGFFADGRAALEDLADAIGSDLASAQNGEDVDTVGGLVFALTGRIPVRGELIAAPDGYEFEVLDADPRRVKRLRIYRRPPSAEPRRRPRHAPETGADA